MCSLQVNKIPAISINICVSDNDVGLHLKGNYSPEDEEELATAMLFLCSYPILILMEVNVCNLKVGFDNIGENYETVTGNKFSILHGIIQFEPLKNHHRKDMKLIGTRAKCLQIKISLKHLFFSQYLARVSLLVSLKKNETKMLIVQRREGCQLREAVILPCLFKLCVCFCFLS